MASTPGHGMAAALLLFSILRLAFMTEARPGMFKVPLWYQAGGISAVVTSSKLLLETGCKVDKLMGKGLLMLDALEDAGDSEEASMAGETGAVVAAA